MKHILKFGLTACLAAAFVFAGCKKDDDNDKYSVTLSANNADWGTVAGGGEFADGTEISIMATSNSGYHFENWSDGDASNPRTLTVTKNIALIAVFAEGAGNQQNGGQSSQQGQDNQQPVADGDILPKKVTKIVMTNSKEDFTETYLFDILGRIISSTEAYKGKVEETETYTYTDNTIVCTQSDQNGKEEQKTIFKVENGRIVSDIFSEVGQAERTSTYTYTSDGYLASITETGVYESKYTATGGNITECESSYKSGDYESNYKQTVMFGDKPNNLNVDVTLLILDYDLYPLSGYYGKRNKNLPSSSNDVHTRIEGDKYESTYVDQYTYTYDGDYLTKITDTYSTGEYTYEIFYE